MLLEYLLTHGPESIAEEFQSDEDVIRQMESFQYVDEKGLVNFYAFISLFPMPLVS